MNDLVQFIQERANEKEVAAVRSQAVRDKLDEPYRQMDSGVRNGSEYVWRETSANPARDLREVAAIRRILGWADSPALPDHERRYVLAAIAAIDSDHPDCKEEWKS